MAYFGLFLLVTAILAAILAFSGEERRSAETAKYLSMVAAFSSFCLMFAAWRKRRRKGRGH